jgi:hypothetical protein
MAEVQKTTVAGETAQHFVEFIIMHQQQTLLAMGKHPNPPAAAPPPNLGLAKAFIDQLCAIRDRTRGNLSPDEGRLLQTALTGLQMSYVEASRAARPS